MSIVLELALEFVLGEDVALEPEDPRFGLERGFIKAAAVIDIATAEVKRGSADPVLQDLAALLRDKADRVPDVLQALDDPERIHDPRESARKWLYLELRAAYADRDRLADPLGVVEQIYADFEYPPAIASFVRYMPLQPGDEPGESALISRLADFLDREHRSLARRPA